MTTNGSEWRRLQLERTLEQWRASNFDPHVVLGIPVGATPEQIIDAHRRWVAAYHPDLHDNDPLATELTKRLNAARDGLLGNGRRESQSQREQRQRREQARQQRTREAEQRRQDEERQQRTQQVEQQRRQEEARRQVVREAERLIRDAAQKRQETANRRSTRSQYQQQSQRESYAGGYDAHRARQDALSHRKLPLRWVATSIVLVSIIIAYLILTVQTPAAVDSLMDEWASLFDEALARNIDTTGS